MSIFNEFILHIFLADHFLRFLQHATYILRLLLSLKLDTA